MGAPAAHRPIKHSREIAFIASASFGRTVTQSKRNVCPTMA